MKVWPMGVYAVLVIALVTAMLAASYLLGQRHSERATGDPYEGGIVSEGSGDVRFALRFFLVAMFFVIVDVESVFIFSWAIAGRELGWHGYWEVLIFIAILGTALGYLWRLGALDWNLKARPR